jgi:hypothetical protein
MPTIERIRRMTPADMTGKYHEGIGGQQFGFGTAQEHVSEGLNSTS